MKSDRNIKDFLAEAEDILESASQALLTIESGQSEGRPEPEQVNALFRAIHSFKGLAGMFDLKVPADLSHKMEFLLDEVRLGKVGLSREALDVLFDAAALLGRLVQQAGSGQEPEEIAPMVERIDAVLQAKPAAASDRSVLNEIDLDRGLLQVLTEYEEFRLKENIRGRKNLFLVKVVFELADFEAGITGLNETLKKEAEIICTLPTAGAGGSGIGFTIMVGTAKSRDELKASVTVPNAAIEQVPYVEGRKAEEPRQEAGLRSVSNTVRVDIYKLDSLMNTVGEMHLVKNIIGRIVRELKSQQGASSLAADLHKAQRGLERKLNELQEGILEVRMVPIGQIFNRLTQMVRKYAKDAGKEIDLRLSGEETELDKLMVEDLADPLMHLIRNAVDHGIESPEVRRQGGKPEQGVVVLSASPKGNHVVITVEDDGAGMDPRKILAKAVEKGVLTPDHGLDPETDRKEILDLVFLPGFTTRETVTEISGRGVGMDVVKKNLSKLSGMIDVETEIGEGSRFTMTLPITLAIIKALIVEAGGQTFAVPLSSVLEIIRTTEDQVETVETREVIAIRNETVPLLRLTEAFMLPVREGRSSLYLIIVGLAERRLGIVVEALRDQQEIVIKPMGKRLSKVRGIAGATELGDRRGVVLVLDVESLMEGVLKKTSAGPIR
ncbi:MAG TPA: chemotaxis protein CheA [Nitrospirota bacterium]|nr:chemotaxis protein CheA [Nitrospirota bacterium]